MAKLVLLIFAAVVYTCAAKNVGTHPIIPFKKGQCLPASNMMKNFEPERFFTGTWYERSSYENDLTQADGKCSTMTAKITDGKVQMQFTHYDGFPFSRYTFVRGEASLEDTRSASFRLDMAFFPDLVEKYPIGILDTDYENYAVVYSCRKVEANLSDEMVWTFTRSRSDTSNDGLIDRAVKLAGFKPEAFTHYGPMNCPADEPTL
uniref:Lipocalin-like protein 3 n=1 Tax=Pristhesancus plagipennis TaxID=1955184 RepID=A0A1Q1NP49_PRIPG|nr:lipocalin-like protein 3 [Pristhesancus plagipennis]